MWVRPSLVPRLPPFRRHAQGEEPGNEARLGLGELCLSIIVLWKHKSIIYIMIKSCWSIIMIVTLPRSDLVRTFMIEQLELA